MIFHLAVTKDLLRNKQSCLAEQPAIPVHCESCERINNVHSKITLTVKKERKKEKHTSLKTIRISLAVTKTFVLLDFKPCMVALIFLFFSPHSF